MSARLYSRELPATLGGGGTSRRGLMTRVSSPSRRGWHVGAAWETVTETRKGGGAAVRGPAVCRYVTAVRGAVPSRQVHIAGFLSLTRRIGRQQPPPPGSLVPSVLEIHAIRGTAHRRRVT